VRGQVNGGHKSFTPPRGIAQWRPAGESGGGRFHQRAAKRPVPFGVLAAPTPRLRAANGLPEAGSMMRDRLIVPDENFINKFHGMAGAQPAKIN